MILNISNVTKSYPGFELNCSMEVHEGRITGLIGANGAGKSTLFKIILQLVFASGGKVEIFDKDLAKLTEDDKRKIGAVMADSTFSGYITIADAKKILASFYPAFDQNFFEQKCRDLGLNETKKISELSTGMKAKFKVLCAISRNSELLILDEPTSGLDVLARDDVLQMLREYMEEDEKRAILISSHISTDLETLCDDFYMIDNGRIVLHEDTDRLLSDYALIKTDVKGFESLDRKYILRKKKEPFGYSCLTDHREYYTENYPDLIIEKSGFDELITLMVKGETL